MPRLRCPRCSNIFPKPEGEPVCPFCSYAPRPAEEPAEPDIVDVGKPTKEQKRAAKEAKALAKAEAKQARKAAKADPEEPDEPEAAPAAATPPVAAAAPTDAAAATEVPRAEPALAPVEQPRRFFGKKRRGGWATALLSLAFIVFVAGSVLPFQGSFDVPPGGGINDANVHIATGHFVLERINGTTEVQTYLAGKAASVDNSAALLGEIVLSVGILLTFITIIFSMAKRPGHVVALSLLSVGAVVGGMLMLQSAIDGFPGDLFPMAQVTLASGALLGVLALIIALVRAVRRPA